MNCKRMKEHAVARAWRAKALGILLTAATLAAGQEVPPNRDPATPAPPIGAAQPKNGQPEQLPPAPRTEYYPIDLPTALRLADGQNPEIQFARERILAAEAELARADILLLPNLTGGGEWLRHDGQTQRVEGPVIPVSKSSIFGGGGFHVGVAFADAYFEPLAVRQLLANRMAGARTTANDTLRNVAFFYYEMIRAKALLATAQETFDNAQRLDGLAQSYFRNDKLREADAARVRAEFRTRGQDLENSRQNTMLASIRLAQQLRLDPFVMLDPVETKALPIILVDIHASSNELTIIALTNRPELAENQALANFAVERLRRATYGPLFPSVLLDYRAGVFAGGKHDFVGDAGARGDVDAALVWELHNLGFGDYALKKQRESEVRQAQIQVVGVMDQIVAQVADAVVRLRSLEQQVEAARQAVASAERSYELNWKLFTIGSKDLITPLEVLQSVQALAAARAAYLNAIVDYDKAQFQLYWALGNPVEHAKPAAAK